MEKFLSKIKLIDDFTEVLPIRKVEFVQRLNNIVEESALGYFSGVLEVFSDKKYMYKGTVSGDGFRIKKKTFFRDYANSYTIATGVLTESEGHLKVDCTVKANSKMFVVFYVFLLFVYSMILFSLSLNIAEVVLVGLFLFVHAFIMIYLSYRFLKGSVEKLRYELIREFYYLTKPE